MRSTSLLFSFLFMMGGVYAQHTAGNANGCSKCTYNYTGPAGTTTKTTGTTVGVSVQAQPTTTQIMQDQGQQLKNGIKNVGSTLPTTPIGFQQGTKGGNTVNSNVDPTSGTSVDDFGFNPPGANPVVTPSDNPVDPAIIARLDDDFSNPQQDIPVENDAPAPSTLADYFGGSPTAGTLITNPTIRGDVDRKLDAAYNSTNEMLQNTMENVNSGEDNSYEPAAPMQNNISELFPQPVQRGIEIAQQINNTSLADVVKKGASWVSDHPREVVAVAVYVVEPELLLVDAGSYLGSKLMEKAMAHEAGLDQ